MHECAKTGFLDLSALDATDTIDAIDTIGTIDTIDTIGAIDTIDDQYPISERHLWSNTQIYEPITSPSTNIQYSASGANF